MLKAYKLDYEDRSKPKKVNIESIPLRALRYKSQKKPERESCTDE